MTESEEFFANLLETHASTLERDGYTHMPYDLRSAAQVIRLQAQAFSEVEDMFRAASGGAKT